MNRYVSFTVSVLIAALVPLTIVSAQAASTSPMSDLENSILASLLADPRTSSLPPAQLHTMVTELARQAELHGIGASDIAVQPASTTFSTSDEDTTLDACGSNFMGYFCMMSRSFGFGMPDYSIPLILFAIAGMLSFIIWELIAHHKKKHNL